MFPRWLPLYLLAVAMLTLFPFATPWCGLSAWRIAIQPSDMLANIVLFVPVGIALRGTPLPRMLALALAFSLSIELAQLWLPRSPDVTDLVMNTTGAWLGRWLALQWTARWDEPLLRPVTARLVLRGATFCVLLGTVVQSVANPANDLSNWEPYPMVLGNDASGARPWIGEISEVAFFDRALGTGERTEVQFPAEASQASPAWRDGGPIAWLKLDGDVPTARIDGPDGPQIFQPELTQVAPAPRGTEGLWLTAAGAVVDPRISRHVVDRLREAGTLTMDVRMRPTSLHQRGPARIVSISDGSRERNLMLGQNAAGLLVRLRTPGTGPRGTRPQFETSKNVLSGREQFVRLIYDGHDAQLWIDGECAAEAELSVKTSLPFLAEPLGVMLILCVALSALTAASFLPGHRLRIPAAVAAGCLAWALLFSVGTWEHLESFGLRALIVGALALVASLPLLREEPEATSPRR